MQTIRVGLLIDSLMMPAWMRRLIELLAMQPNVEIALVIKNALGKRPTDVKGRLARSDETFTGIANHILLAGWKRLDRQLFKLEMDACKIVDASPILGAIPILAVSPEKHRTGCFLNKRDIERIAKFDLTVLLQLGCADLTGDALDIASCGVWLLKHGNDTRGRSDSAGIWEVLFNQRTVSTSLLMRRRDNGHIEETELYRSWTATYPLSFHRSANKCYWKGVSFIPRKLRELSRNGESAFLAQHTSTTTCSEEAANANLHANTKTIVKPLGALMFRIMQGAMSKLCLREQWILLYEHCNGPQKPNYLSELKRLVPPQDRFWADPCAVTYQGKSAIFIEELEYAKKAAHLSVIEFDHNGTPILPPVKVLEKPYHLSYPFVFEDNGQLYMIPETHQNRTVQIYRCVAFPYRWEFVMNLIEDIVAVDATVWHHRGKYWLFMNVIEHRGAAAEDELFLYFSDTLLSNDWKPHPANPIVSDARRARPAGRIFKQQGQWYRPSQDCSGGYGRAISINRIDVINEQAYEETPHARIEPNWDNEVFRTHTLTRSGDLLCIDGMIMRAKI